MTLTQNANDVTVTNNDPGSAVALTSAGGTASLVQDGVGPALAIRGLIGGTGITVTQNANDVTIVNSSPASSVTLAAAAGSVGTSLVGSGAGPALTVKGIASGTNTTAATSGAGDVAVNLNAALTAMTSFAGTGGSSIVMTGVNTINLTNCTELISANAPNASTVQTAASNIIAFGAAPSAQTLAIAMTPGFLGGFSTTAPGQLTYNVPYGQRKWVFMYTISFIPAALTAGSLVFFVSINGNVSTASATLAKAKTSYLTVPAGNLLTTQMTIIDTIRILPGDTIMLGCQLATGGAQNITFSGATLSMFPLLST